MNFEILYDFEVQNVNNKENQGQFQFFVKDILILIQ